MPQQSLKIAVAEQNTIVRMGMIATLKRLLGSNATFLEVANPNDLYTRLASFVPSIIIISPSFGNPLNILTLRDKPNLYARGARFVALLSQLVNSSATANFDAQISIFDSEDDILALIDQLQGRDADTTDDASDSLSEREKEVVRGVVSGLANKEIADQLNISVYTVLTHRRNIARKLNIHSSIALTIYAISNKLVDVNDIK